MEDVKQTLEHKHALMAHLCISQMVKILSTYLIHILSDTQEFYCYRYYQFLTNNNTKHKHCVLQDFQQYL